MIALRYVGAVLIGMLVGGLVIGAIQLVGMLLFPLPGGMTAAQFQALSREEMRELLHSAPPVVYLPVLLGYLLGALAGGSVATILWPERKLTGALLVGALFTLANVGNAMSIPQPLWVTIASFAILFPAALVGGLLTSRRNAAAKGDSKL
jgi:hypothetical protein